MKDDKGKWWLFGLPLLICLPCIFPVAIAILLAAGGAGAIGSFFGGAGGIAVLVVGIVLLAIGAAVYLRWRAKRAAVRMLSLRE